MTATRSAASWTSSRRWSSAIRRNLRRCREGGSGSESAGPDPAPRSARRGGGTRVDGRPPRQARVAGVAHRTRCVRAPWPGRRVRGSRARCSRLRRARDGEGRCTTRRTGRCRARSSRSRDRSSAADVRPGRGAPVVHEPWRGHGVRRRSGRRPVAALPTAPRRGNSFRRRWVRGARSRRARSAGSPGRRPGRSRTSRRPRWPRPATPAESGARLAGAWVGLGVGVGGSVRLDVVVVGAGGDAKARAREKERHVISRDRCGLTVRKQTPLGSGCEGTNAHSSVPMGAVR